MALKKKVDPIDFEDIKWGSFTAAFDRYNATHAKKSKDLLTFANMILRAPKDKFTSTTRRRASFYKNVLAKPKRKPKAPPRKRVASQPTQKQTQKQSVVVNVTHPKTTRRRTPAPPRAPAGGMGSTTFVQAAATPAAAGYRPPPSVAQGDRLHVEAKERVPLSARVPEYPPRRSDTFPFSEFEAELHDILAGGKPSTPKEPPLTGTKFMAAGGGGGKPVSTPSPMAAGGGSSRVRGTPLADPLEEAKRLEKNRKGRVRTAEKKVEEQRRAEDLKQATQEAKKRKRTEDEVREEVNNIGREETRREAEPSLATPAQPEAENRWTHFREAYDERRSAFLPPRGAKGSEEDPYIAK